MKNNIAPGIRFGLLIAMLTLPFHSASSQDATFNYLTLYYVDNSDGYNMDQLNDGQVTHIRESLKTLQRRPDNFFYFYGADGIDAKMSSNLTNLVSAAWLKKYLNNPSRNSENLHNKRALRDYFLNNQVTINQNVEIHIYFSEHSLKKLINDFDSAPLLSFFTGELPYYVNDNPAKRKGLRIKMIYYLSTASKQKLGEEQFIRSYIEFFSSALKLDGISTEIIYL